MHWFENWFNSPYYHILYKNRDEKEAQVFIDNLIHHLQIKKSSKLIDIACGKGRHAKHFNSLGFDVVGVDLSPNSIATAKQNENTTLTFAVHDMRQVYQKNYFDVVTNLFTSFGYFDTYQDEQKAIGAMTSNLKSGGLLIIDFMNIKKVIANLVASEYKIIDGIIFDIKRKVENELIIKDIYIKDGTIKQYFQEKVKAISLESFTKLIDNQELKIINIFGNYKLEDFNAITSNRLILVCRK